MDAEDIRGARTVVSYLFDEGQRWYPGGSPGKSWLNTLRVIGQPFNVLVGKAEVDNQFLVSQTGSGVMSGEFLNRNILLAPPATCQSVVCLLGVSWDVKPASSEFSLYLHMFGESARGNTPVWYRGYRLELGHGRGIHEYTHVQPVKAIGWPRMAIPFEDQSIPDTVPAFPVRGAKLTTLCAALAIGLHGSSVGGSLDHLLRDNSTLADVQSLLA